MAQAHPTINSKTGGAQIVKVGHTTSGQFGSEYMAKPKGRRPASELNAK